MKILQSALLVGSLAVASVNAQDKCYALALSSGDMSGAYQAGVLGALFENLPADQVAYHTVSGVASGAVNAAIVSGYPVGSEAGIIAKLQEFWTEAATTDLYKDWLGGLAQGLLLEGGLYNTAPLEKFLKGQFSGASLSRHTTLGLVDLIGGKYLGMQEGDLLTSEDLTTALYASLSFVGFYPPVEAWEQKLVDGAAVWDIDIPATINYCLEQGYAEEDVVVDVVMTKSAELDYEDTSEYNSLQMLFRYLHIARYYGIMDGLKRAEFAYPKANFRYVVGPSEKLPHNFEPLKFNSTDMEAMYQQGYQDALTQISNGEGVGMRTTVDAYVAFKNSMLKVDQNTESAKPDVHKMAMTGDFATIQKQLFEQIVQQ